MKLGIDIPLQAGYFFGCPIVGDAKINKPGQSLAYPFGDLVWARMIVPAGHEALIAVRPTALKEVDLGSDR